ncbi:MAG TPA: UDP-3-O-(3-hydroxymyristoyl)glucosamine N-acyltransferase [Casimicrobiaceae bacterium]|nr:UDP-3-O-(3-hydroxymyristoyl)glucosamine N-acyltransferase [Casimicrobiaceae bacterium]
MDRDAGEGFTLSELSRRTGARLEGDGAMRVRRVASLANASADAIAFLANPKYRSQLEDTRAGAVVLSERDAGACTVAKLVSDNPYATYARIAALLHPSASRTPRVDARAIVDPSADVASDVAIAAYAVVGPRARIGTGATIGAGCVIGNDAFIGEAAVLHPNVVVYERCEIGARTVVHAGAVIGADGFGLADEGGRWVRVPQLGRVVLGEDCEIGANTTIDRGAIDDTLIEDDVKLDNQIQIGHNVTIGRHTAIAACTGIAGSSHIGRNCRIGGGVMIAGHLSIPDGTIIGGATVVIATLKKAGTYTSLLPAMPHREWQHAIVGLRHVASLVERVRALERAQRGKDRS